MTPHIVSRPQGDARLGWCAGLWVLGSASAVDLYEAIAFGAPFDPADTTSDAYHGTLEMLFELETHGCIAHTCPVRLDGCSLAACVFAPNYDDDAIPEWLAGHWPPCPKCHERNALIARTGDALTLTCRPCRHSLSHARWLTATARPSPQLPATSRPIAPLAIAKIEPTPTLATAPQLGLFGAPSVPSNKRKASNA